MRPGDHFYEVINQSDRYCEVLAVLGDEMIYEYEMPKGTTSMRIAKIDGTGKARAASYYTLPLKWLRAIVDAGMLWLGYPQQRAQTKPLPGSPREMLEARLGKALETKG